MLLTAQKALREERVTQVAQYIAFGRKGSKGEREREKIRERLMAEDVVSSMK